MESTKRRTLTFGGTGDVVEGLAKVNLMNVLKEYEGEKLATPLASCLQGNAFDVYLRLSEGDSKDIDNIKTEVGRMDREKEDVDFANRERLSNAPAKTCAYKLQQLASLVYPDLYNAVMGLIIKDAYVRWLHPSLQLEFKSLEKFATANVKDSIQETNRLELTGLRLTLNIRLKNYINVVEPTNDGNSATRSITAVEEELIQTISDAVVTKLKCESVHFVRNRPNVDRVSTGNSKNRRLENTRDKKLRQCRKCGSTSHLVCRCPNRFCASCGEKGHYSWDTQCAKYLRLEEVTAIPPRIPSR